MATFQKPAAVPRWATDLVNVALPPGGQQTTGWTTNQVPPSNFENWRSNLVGEFLAWVDERTADNGGSGDGFRIIAPGVPAVFLELHAGTSEARLESGELFFDIGGTVDFAATDDFIVNADGEVNILGITDATFRSASDATILAGGVLNLQTGGNILVSGGHFEFSSGVDIYFGASANGNMFTFEPGVQTGAFQWSHDGSVELSFTEGRATTRTGGRGSLEPGGDGEWDLGTSTQRWRGVNATEGVFTGDRNTPTSQVDLVSRHGNNAPVANVSFDYNGTVPAVVNRLGDDWNISSVARTGTGNYRITFNQAVDIYSSPQVNVPDRLSDARFVSSTVLDVHVYDRATGASTDISTTAGLHASVTVVGSPNTHL